MAIVLSYGNTPPSFGSVQLGEKVSSAEHSKLISCGHEQWAAAGECFGGLVYDRGPWVTTSTLYTPSGIGAGGGWSLDRWQPLCELGVRHNGGTQAVIAWKGYVRNIDLRVDVLNAAYTILGSTTQVCTSNTPQWLSQLAIASSLDISDIRILRVLAKRNTYSADGALYHFAARSRPNSAIQIPVGS